MPHTFLNVLRSRALTPVLMAAVLAGYAFSVADAPSAEGIHWEDQQRLMPAPPQRPIATRSERQTRICWQRPPAPTTRIDAYDPRIVFYRVYREDKSGVQTPIGETRHLCFVDRELRAGTSAYVVTAITRSGHESDISEKAEVPSKFWGQVNSRRIPRTGEVDPPVKTAPHPK